MARVLVVDGQDYSVGVVVKALVEAEGHTVVWARTARSAIWALDKADTYEPDTAAYEVRSFGEPLEEMPRRGDFDVVVLNTLLDLGAGGSAITAGAEDYQLGERILEWLRRDRASDVPVLVRSAFLDEAAMLRVQAHGLVRTVDKLRPSADVLREIEAALVTRPSRRADRYIDDGKVVDLHKQAEVNVLALTQKTESLTPRQVAHGTLEILRESTFATETALLEIRSSRPYRVILGSQSARSFVQARVPADDAMDQWAPGTQPHTRVNGGSTWGADIAVDNYVAARVGAPGQGVKQLLAKHPPPTLALVAANRAPAGSKPDIPPHFSCFDAQHMEHVARLVGLAVSQHLKAPVGQMAISLLMGSGRGGSASPMAVRFVGALLKLWQYHLPKGDPTEAVIWELIQIANAAPPALDSASACPIMAEAVSRAVTGGMDHGERLRILGQLAEAGLRRR